MNRYWAAALALGLLAGCTQKDLEEPAEITVTASWAESSQAPASKTVLQEDGTTVFWQTDEQINVFLGSSMAGRFYSVNAEPAASATFRGGMHSVGSTGNNQTYWALYPYSGDATCDGSSVTFTVPDAQEVTEGTFANNLFPALATSATRDLHFYNVCGGARFSVTRADITEVTFASLGGEAIAGRVRVGFSATGVPAVQEVLDGKPSVTVQAPTGGFKPGENYFVAMLPGVLESGLSVFFRYGTDMTLLTKLERRIEIHRSVFGMLDGIGPVAVTGVNINPEQGSVTIGETLQLTATVSPGNATLTAVTWSSSDTDVATVDENGLVTACAVGTATITVETQDGGFQATCTVEVTPIKITSLTLNESEKNLTPGQTFQLNATIVPSDATDNHLVWSSADSQIASVNQDGLVTARANGSTVITVEDASGEVSASCRIHVTTPVTGVSLNQTSATIGKNETLQLTATVTPSTASNRKVTWTSSKTSVATVDQNGLVKGVAGGSTTITVKTDDGNYSATCSVSVVIPVTGISLSPSPVSLFIGQECQMTVTCIPSDATNKAEVLNATGADRYIYIDNDNVAIINVNNLKVTAMAKGTTTLKVVLKGFSSTVTLTVKDPSPAAVDLGLSVKWGDRNLYASSATAAGRYYLATTAAPSGSSDIVEQVTDGAWRMPTKAEMDELISNCSFTRTTRNGVDGYNVTGPSGNSIFLPLCGMNFYGTYYSHSAGGTTPYLTKTFSGSSYYRLKFNFSDAPVCELTDQEAETVIRPVQ